MLLFYFMAEYTYTVWRKQTRKLWVEELKSEFDGVSEHFKMMALVNFDSLTVGKV